MTILFIRTCQSCGHRINPPFNEIPKHGEPITDTYRNKKCPKCDSIDFDYGSDKNVDKNTLEDIPDWEDDLEYVD